MHEATPTFSTDSNRSCSRQPAARRQTGQILQDLVINGSIELSTAKAGAVEAAAKLLPFGMTVYLPQLPRHPLENSLDLALALHQAGLDPVPHIAARQVASIAALRSYLDRVVRESGVHRVMVIGGDSADAAGPFADSAALIGSGIFPDTGIHEIDVAGYPEGHPRIPGEILKADLRAKLELASAQGLGLSIVTQFSFVPSRIVEYCDELAHDAPQVPVYVGMAGPTDSLSLLRYARHCGVSESLRALGALGVKAAKLACHTSPDEQLDVLARYCAAHEVSNVIGIHVFSFGGFERSVQWMRKKFR